MEQSCARCNLQINLSACATRKLTATDYHKVINLTFN